MVLGGVLFLAVVAAATLLARPGLQWAGLGVGLLVLAWVSARTTAGSSAPATSASDQRWRLGFALLATALLVSVAVRDSGPMTAVVTLAALGLVAWAGLLSARPLGVLAAPLLAVVSAWRGLAWLTRSARPRRPVSGALPALRGAAFGVVLLIGVGALLVSADDAFAGLAYKALPTPNIDWLPVRALLGSAVLLLGAGIAFSAAAPAALGPEPTWTPRARIEWLLPLGALIALLAVFLVVQAAVLFDAYPAALVAGDLTPAERARSGFGQLVAVTIVLATVLGWAAARVAEQDRRLLVALGVVTIVLVETLVASALRRMFLYEDAFGWSVLRLDVAVFEVWLGLVVPAAALLWLTGRGPSVTRVMVASAGIGVLGLALVGPDAVVASASVDRYERTGRIDVSYLTRLGPDATPALARLPEPVATCVLGFKEPADDPWYALNMSRLRADPLVADKRAAGVPIDLQCPPSR